MVSYACNYIVMPYIRHSVRCYPEGAAADVLLLYQKVHKGHARVFFWQSQPPDLANDMGKQLNIANSYEILPRDFSTCLG